MEMDAKRAGILKKVNIAHYAIVVIVALFFLQWFMPYFKYDPINKKDTKTQCSMWSEILFNYNFMQLENVMSDALDPALKFKHVTLRYVGAPVLAMIFGIITLCTMGKKGIAFSVFPLVMSIMAIKGWFFGNLIPQYCNVPISKILGGILAILLLIATIAKIVFCIMEIRSRPAEFYLPSLH